MNKSRSGIRRKWSTWGVTALAILPLTACLDLAASSPPLSVSSAYTANPEVFAGEATLLAVGDIMVHMPQLPAYYDPKTRSYDFSPWFREVSPIFHSADWVVGNLETPLAGSELKYTGFPRFNAPPELADALADSGMQLVSTANNHAMDRGFAGIERTLANVRKAGLLPYGTSASLEDSERQVIVERGGIRMGFLAYTYGTNGLEPANRAYAVNRIDPVRMEKDIRRLRQSGADAVTVSLHFGTEYQTMPNAEQRRLARSAVAFGADIVLGSHPHVLQPYDVLEIPAAESSTGQDRRGVVIYSLGNFISNQTGEGKDTGLIFGVHLLKLQLEDGTFRTEWDNVTFTPTWVQIEVRQKQRHYTILPLRRTLDHRNHPSLTEPDYKRLASLLAGAENHLHAFRK
jgi:poly-gamma-glutamate capsule biosynthesis protein CapA/YwtB (metallophosphatase superfamily)